MTGGATRLASTGDYTPLQQKFLAVLADGQRHTREELLACMDEYADPAGLKANLYHLRVRLRAGGMDIVAEVRYRRVYYRQVMVLPQE